MNVKKEIVFLTTNLSSKYLKFKSIAKRIYFMSLAEKLKRFFSGSVIYFFNIANRYLHYKKRLFTKTMQTELCVIAVNGEQVKSKIGSVLNA